MSFTFTNAQIKVCKIIDFSLSFKTNPCWYFNLACMHEFQKKRMKISPAETFATAWQIVLDYAHILY